MKHLLALVFFSLSVIAGEAAECSHENALGVSREIAIDPMAYPKIGRMQYPVSLPLQDKEVVLTFDDGPLPPYTTRVLETLKQECVKATFFIVGRMAKAYPETLKRVADEGHTIANHSQNHPLDIFKRPVEFGQQEIASGLASIHAVLGEHKAISAYFRFPGLGRTVALEHYLAEHQMAAWSADFPVDDWLKISGDEVMSRALSRLEQHGKGVMLLHDIQPSTVNMLPELLRTLKARGYKIVHVVPAPAGSQPAPAIWLADDPKGKNPRLVVKAKKPAVAVKADDTGDSIPVPRTPWPRVSDDDVVARKPVPVAKPKAEKTEDPLLPWIKRLIPEKITPGTPPTPIGDGASAASSMKKTELKGLY